MTKLKLTRQEPSLDKSRTVRQTHAHLHLHLIYAVPHRPDIPGLGLAERGSSSEDFLSVRGWNGTMALHHCIAFPSQMSGGSAGSLMMITEARGYSGELEAYQVSCDLPSPRPRWIWDPRFRRAWMVGISVYSPDRRGGTSGYGI
jgi:hypothetical protein